METNYMCQKIVDTVLEPICSRGIIQMFHGNQIDVKVLDEPKNTLRTFYNSEMFPMKPGDTVYIRKCPDCGVEVLYKSPDIDTYFAWRFYTLLYHH